MPYLYLFILAVIQGITEFLPISSSGHLAAMPQVMAWPDQGLLIDVSVHVGTLVAVMVYFRRDVMALACGGLAVIGVGKKCQAQAKLFRLLVLASLPVLAVGGVLAVSGYGEIFRRVDIIAAASIGFGLLLYLADQKGGNDKFYQNMQARPALMIGLAQVLALIPGASRAGVTMTAARMLGFKRTEAARFSMLLSIPVIMAAGSWSTYQLITTGTGGDLAGAAFAAAVSFLTALAAIHFLMTWLERASMTIFVVYRVLFGAALLFWVVF
ncbi:MAG: undecaprenyl-diphosphate phosphatase [Proteobacteria bacterium]|nr:undecaprenyl-diphosphate phosphatase [Pseudomonadota bacterium]